MRNALRASAALACALLAAPALPASACTCTDQVPLQQEFDQAWMVFSGRVLEIQPDPFGTLAVFLEPIQRWKGPLDHVQLVVTPDNEGVCGFTFQVGQEYLLFCSSYPYGITYTPTPFTHLCTRTGLLAGNPHIADLPPPLGTTASRRSSWGALKLFHR